VTDMTTTAKTRNRAPTRATTEFAAHDRRIERLREFWNRVSGRVPFVLPAGMDFALPFMNRMAAAAAMTIGVPGFFTPRVPAPFFAREGSLEALSFYDTEPLRETLEELVEFDRIQRGDVRLSLGAVNLRTGESVYFDSTKDKITASHVMASGALPPGFPPVEIDGDYYLDGGIMSNTPLQYVAQDFRMNAQIVQVDLVSGAGELPRSVDRVQERVKDIQFQSKNRFSHAQIRQLEAVRSAHADVITWLSAKMRSDPQVRKLAEISQRGPVSLVHLVNRHDIKSSDFKDYELSRATVDELWLAWHNDVQRVVKNPGACHVTDLGNGVRVFDL